MIKIKIKLLSIKNALTEYDNVSIIRIKSKKYNLNIMRDYIPIIGELDGSIEFEYEGNFIKLENIVGYYMHKQNQFNLLLKKEN